MKEALKLRNSFNFPLTLFQNPEDVLSTFIFNPTKALNSLTTIDSDQNCFSQVLPVLPELDGLQAYQMQGHQVRLGTILERHQSEQGSRLTVAN